MPIILEGTARIASGDKNYAPLGADEFGMPIQPTPKPVVATESEATRITSVPAEPANGTPEPEPSTAPARIARLRGLRTLQALSFPG